LFSIDQANGPYLRLTASGRLSSSDYDMLEPALADALAARGGRAPLLLDLTGWRGWTAGGILRDMLFDLKHSKSFARTAVVGDRSWHKWLTWAAAPLFRGPMRYFEAGREQAAVDWLRMFANVRAD
jgi:SpoIIAA-like